MKKSTPDQLLYRFPANVNIYNTNDAWSKFYAHVWRKNFHNIVESRDQDIDNDLRDALKEFHASLRSRSNNNAYYYVLFSSEKHYTWFMMRWA